MSPFDILAALTVVLFAGIGALRGFGAELSSLLAWIAAGATAWLYSPTVASWLAPVLSDRFARRAIAFIVCFVVVFLTVFVVAFVLRKLVFRGPLKGPDHALGAAFGALRGVVVVVALVLLAGLTGVPHQAWWRDSLSARYFEALALRLVQQLPPEVARHFRYG